MKYLPYQFLSYPEMIRDISYDVAPYYCTYGILETIRAFANMALAEQDVRESAKAVRKYAYTHPDTLIAELVNLDACSDGLSVVGTHVTYHSLERIFEVRDDWRVWYSDMLRIQDEDAREREEERRQASMEPDVGW